MYDSFIMRGDVLLVKPDTDPELLIICYRYDNILFLMILLHCFNDHNKKQGDMM